MLFALIVLTPSLACGASRHLTPPPSRHPSHLARRTAPPRAALAQERLESAKSAAVSTLAGSLAAAPAALLLAPDAFSAQWELDHDALALELALFGVVYRYAVREDANPMLKQGVVGAFALTRVASALDVSPQCTSLPLSCGPPLGYVDWAMLGQLAATGVESALAFGGAALALELGFGRGWLARLSGSMPLE